LTRTRTLEQAQAAAVEEGRDEAVDARELGQEASHLVPREHDREAPRPGRTDELVDALELAPEDGAVQEQQGAQRLVLGRCQDAAADREVGEEGNDLARAHFVRVALPVEEDEAADPGDVGRLGARAQVPEAGRLADAVEEARRGALRRVHRRSRGRLGVSSRG